MGTINFKASAKLTGIRPRLEGSKSEDQQVRGLDLKLAATLPASVLAVLIHAEQEEAAAFWIVASDGLIPAYPGLGALKSNRVFDNCNLSIDKQKFQAAQARGFQFTIEPENVLNATFTVRLYDLSNATIGALMRDYQEVISITLESAQIDAFEGQANE